MFGESKNGAEDEADIFFLQLVRLAVQKVKKKND